MLAEALPVDELKYLLLLELLIKSRGCCQLLLFFQALLVQVTLKQKSFRYQKLTRPSKIDFFLKKRIDAVASILLHRCYSISISSRSIV